MTFALRRLSEQTRDSVLKALGGWQLPDLLLLDSDLDQISSRGTA
jgi:hypothetical protein